MAGELNVLEAVSHEFVVNMLLVHRRRGVHGQAVKVDATTLLLLKEGFDKLNEWAKSSGITFAFAMKLLAGAMNETTIPDAPEDAKLKTEAKTSPKK